MYWLYAAATFLSAALVFSIQPMLGKMLLPIAGGAPAVWTTAMVFFQTMLLLGYGYVHLSTRWLSAQWQWKLHLALLLGGIAFLPTSLPAPTASALESAPALWVLGALFTSASLPLLITASTAPLLQRWLALSDHPSAADPYHLYAASNIGSIAALLAYPFVLEPLLGLRQQTWLWLASYAMLGVLLAMCVRWLQQHPGTGILEPALPVPAGASWRQRLRWLLWAFIPSSLLLSVTAVITTDLAPVPLLWVIPLTLYLLTYVHAFAQRRLVSTRQAARCLPLAAIPAATALALGLAQPLTLVAILHLALLTAAALVFHGLLADDRPSPRQLTEFYFWLALGGAGGGLFNALLAPLAFDRLLEYPLLLLLGLLAIPARFWRDRLLGWTTVFGTGAALLLAVTQLGFATNSPTNVGLLVLMVAVLIAAGLLALILGRRPLLRAVGAAAAALALVGTLIEPAEQLLSLRSFYGTHRVMSELNGNYHLLMHGSTSHGAQYRGPGSASSPLTYYHPSGPVGDVFALSKERRPPGDVAVIGLGSGSLAAYRQPYQHMFFYEIDPAVERIARNPALFSYLERCGRGCQVVLGDGRLQLAQEPPGRFSLIVVDAYSSSAIPLHLLTREALELFVSRLTPDGLLVLHISNRHLRLAPIVARLAEQNGWILRYRRHWIDDADTRPYVFESEWVVIARSTEALGIIASSEHWTEIEATTGRPWTDNYTPLLQALFAR